MSNRPSTPDSSSEDGPEPNEGTPAPSGRAPYRRPRLERLGSWDTLTLQMAVSFGDGST